MKDSTTFSYRFFKYLFIDLFTLVNDDNKSGDVSVIFTPRMIEAYQGYIQHRLKPKNQKDNDCLIIIDKCNYYGLPIQTKRPDFIWRKTKHIAVKAGIKKNVYPYLVKQSAITDAFNKNVNPKIIKR